MFQSSFELTGYITNHDQVLYSHYMDRFKALSRLRVI